jgi:hypothetical protein
MTNLQEYIKKLQDSGASFREQEEALKQIEKTIKESKEKKKDVIASKNADVIVAAFKKIEDKLNKKYEELLRTPALAGKEGPQGLAGKDGKPGRDGRDGAPGRDGVDGKNGVDGKDGVGVVDAKVDFDGSLVIILSDGNEIDAGRVVSDVVAKEFNSFMTRGEIIPLQDGNSGKFLTTDGNTLSWAAVGNTTYTAGTGLDLTGTTFSIDSTVATLTGTQTLTNKRINPRVVAASATTGTITPNGDTTDVYKAEGLTGAITIAVPSGTPVDGQKLMIRLEDNGTARAITWTTSAGGFRAIGITLPTTTVATKITYVGCSYNATDSFWDAVATVTEA